MSYQFEVVYLDGTIVVQAIDPINGETLTESEAWHRVIRRLSLYEGSDPNLFKEGLCKVASIGPIR